MVFRRGSSSLRFECRTLFRVIGESCSYVRATYGDLLMEMNTVRALLHRSKYSSRLTGYLLEGTDERKERCQAFYRPGGSKLFVVCGGE